MSATNYVDSRHVDSELQLNSVFSAPIEDKIKEESLSEIMLGKTVPFLESSGVQVKYSRYDDLIEIQNVNRANSEHDNRDYLRDKGTLDEVLDVKLQNDCRSIDGDLNSENRKTPPVYLEWDVPLSRIWFYKFCSLIQ